MKFVRFKFNNTIAYGVLQDDSVKEISGSIFDRYEISSVSHKINDVQLLPPVEPSKIICVGLNYKEHIKELGYQIPEFPSHFLKPSTAIIGHNDSVFYPKIAKKVSYEGELAIVIKDCTKDVTEEEALEHVLGYTCFNDITERNLAKMQGQLTRAKGFDTFAAFGPCIDTDIDPSNLTIRTFLNGELVQEGETSDMVFSVKFLIFYLSQCMTLLPGDIISTGTPKGIRPMSPGDVVEVSIDSIGILRNYIKELL
jgi:2-keto-4-pentenoate hydratase/2-oxohepta-3-ene-1,7-dioic acid hydratase in catechol pathway